MLDEKKIKETENRVRRFINEGIIRQKNDSRFVPFFLNNADDSIDAAKALIELSTDQKSRESLGFTAFNGLLWTINASYYSMFYMGPPRKQAQGTEDRSLHTRPDIRRLDLLFLPARYPAKSFPGRFPGSQRGISRTSWKAKSGRTH